MTVTILAACVVFAQPAQPHRLDGLEKIVIVSQAKQYAFELRSMNNTDRRKYVVARLAWETKDFSEDDRRWIVRVADWASKPYDVSKRPIAPTSPDRIPPPKPLIDFHVNPSTPPPVR